MRLSAKRECIFVTGHCGLLGLAVLRTLVRNGYDNLLVRTRQELDSRRKSALNRFIDAVLPEFVVVAAACMGRILANDTYPTEFIGANLAMQTRVLHSGQRTGTKRLLFLGSTCIYAREAPQPLKEDNLRTGPLKPTTNMRWPKSNA